MKRYIPAFAIILLLALTGYLGSTAISQTPPTQDVQILSSYAGDPNGNVAPAEQGSVLRDSSANALWVKTGGYGTNGWVKTSLDVFGNAVSSTATLSSGTVAVTNAAFTASSKAFLSYPTNAPAVTVGSTFTTGVMTLTSATNSDARTIRYLVLP